MLFNLRYALQFNEHSEIMFGISRSQKQTLQIQGGNAVENTFTSLSIAAKEKLRLPYKIAVYGYLGMAYSEFNPNRARANTGEAFTPPELDGLSLIYAAGAEWDLIENLGVFVEYGRFYQRQRKEQQRRPEALVDGFTLGLYIRF